MKQDKTAAIAIALPQDLSQACRVEALGEVWTHGSMRWRTESNYHLEISMERLKFGAARDSHV